MDNIEFSNEFDVLYNNIMSNIAPGLDAYEKSVFLTMAQEDIIINIYNGKNPFKDSFEKTEEVRRCLSELIKTYTSKDKVSELVGISKDSVFFKIPEDVWFITYESAIIQDGELENSSTRNALVVPITQDEFYKVQENPFRGPSETRVLRLDNSDNTIELVSKYKLKEYFLKYITKPSPIILEKLQGDLSINGEHDKTECKLNPVIHRAILERAVQIAIQSSTINSIGK